MARPALLASSVCGELEPTSVGLAADLLALADDETPTAEFILYLVDRLYHAFGPASSPVSWSTAAPDGQFREGTGPLGDRPLAAMLRTPRSRIRPPRSRTDAAAGR